jgi:hypothetical protein
MKPNDNLNQLPRVDFHGKGFVQIQKNIYLHLHDCHQDN